MKYKISNKQNLKRQVGFALNRYILKYDIDISTFSATTCVPKTTIIKICLGKNYHWNDLFKILSALNLQLKIGLEHNNT